MKIGFVVNDSHDSNFMITRELMQFVQDNGVSPVLSSTTPLTIADQSIKFDDVYTTCDFVIVIGGDGTLLRAAKYACHNNCNLLGINIKHLGFLTDNNISEAKNSIVNLIEGKFFIEKRMMLSTIVNNINDELLALNDVMITKRDYKVNTIRMKLYVNDDFTNEYVVDSLVISTPTGSTAYNLSLGGPILRPEAKMIIITPAGEHSLISRPIVLSSEDKISIKILSDLKDARILIDGQSYCELSDNVINISTSSTTTNIVKTNNINFYQLLKRKNL